MQPSLNAAGSRFIEQMLTACETFRRPVECLEISFHSTIGPNCSRPISIQRQRVTRWFIRKLVMATVLAVGGLLGWMAPHRADLSKLSRRIEAATQPGAARVHRPLRVQVFPVLHGGLVADLTCDDEV